MCFTISYKHHTTHCNIILASYIYTTPYASKSSLVYIDELVYCIGLNNTPYFVFINSAKFIYSPYLIWVADMLLVLYNVE